MNTQISFAKFITAPDSVEHTEFRATVEDGGVRIDIGIRGWFIAWEKIEDMEALAGIFWSMPVWEFKIVVGMLGEVVRARSTLEALG